ncbi:hypothetical protein FKP32DRAFT_1680100 [Trametes sanguinea]|nr:hypothetical protein FKP32DRAFT_1680100 [Trametes sanguinea]
MPPKNKAADSTRATRPVKRAKNAQVADADTSTSVPMASNETSEPSQSDEPKTAEPAVVELSTPTRVPQSLPPMPSTPHIASTPLAKDAPATPSPETTVGHAAASATQANKSTSPPLSPLSPITDRAPSPPKTPSPLKPSLGRVPSTPSTPSPVKIGGLLLTSPGGTESSPSSTSDSVEHATTIMQYDVLEHEVVSPSPNPTTATNAAPVIYAADLEQAHPAPEAAVQQAMPTGISYVPENTIARLRTIASFRDDTTNRYAVSQLPKRADWGRDQRTEKLLCLNNKPAIIWMVGRVRTMWFFDRNGQPHLRVNIGCVLPFDVDRSAVADLYNRARPRRADNSAPTVVYAAKICSQRGKGDYAATPTAFMNVYDATDKLSAKANMPQLSAVDVVKNDIVLVECHFTRWKPAGESKGKKSWNVFDVGFELLSISLLYSAPDGVEDDEEPLQDAADIAVEL